MHTSHPFSRRLRPVALAALAALAAVAVASPLAAQPRPDASAEVVRTVERMFDAMATRDTATLRALLAPDLVIVSSRATDTGTVVRRQRTPDFLRSIASSAEVLRERMWSPAVGVEGGLATLWAPYDFHIGPRFSHCGVDTFTLARAGASWVVVGLAYTVRPSPCPRPDAVAADVAADSAIRAERARFNDAIARRDAAAIGSLFLPDYHAIAGRGRQTAGGEAAGRQWAEIFRTDPAAVYVRTPRELRVNAPWGLAEELGDWDGRVTANGAVAAVGGSYAAKWARTAAGAWRLQSEVFTSLRCDGPAAACAAPSPPAGPAGASSSRPRP